MDEQPKSDPTPEQQVQALLHANVWERASMRCLGLSQRTSLSATQPELLRALSLALGCVADEYRSIVNGTKLDK